MEPHRARWWVPTEHMYENFTDAENTGAPLVPDVGDPVRNARETYQEHEEVVLSHRIEL